jgi:hypothetical protein
MGSDLNELKSGIKHVLPLCVWLRQVMFFEGASDFR